MKIEQRIGRIDRIGQKKNIVRIYNLLVNGSIDERVLSIMGDKLQLVSGTFADVSGIIDSDVSLSESEMGSLVIENETKTATELVKSFKFYNQISSSDNDASILIATQNCNFLDWSDLDWGNSFPWVNEASRWLEELDHESEKFSDLLTSYQTRGD
jgi:hypothetical protein